MWISKLTKKKVQETNVENLRGAETSLRRRRGTVEEMPEMYAQGYIIVVRDRQYPQLPTYVMLSYPSLPPSLPPFRPFSCWNILPRWVVTNDAI